MTDLFWPGDERAGDLMSSAAFLRAMVAVEGAWLTCLIQAGIAPATAKADLTGVVRTEALAAVGAESESGGNPVIPLVSLLRKEVGSNQDAATWLHRGLTSQDVVDTALMLCARDVLDRLEGELDAQVASVRRLADEHRGTVMAGRTLTQHAVPMTFGLKAAGWLQGLLDAAETVAHARSALAVQVGGAAGTLAAVTELARKSGQDDSEAVAFRLVEELATALGLTARMPWHTSRAPVTTIGDSLVTCTDAFGHIASDVAVLARPEIGELSEPSSPGRGGSSTMPQKQNPVLSVLIRRAAICAPPLAGTLHTAAALAVDERPDAAWHAEWATLRTLSRYAVVAASQTTELVSGLRVNADRMRQTADAAREALLAEQRSITKEDGDGAPESYLGASDLIIDAVLSRAAQEDNR